MLVSVLIGVGLMIWFWGGIAIYVVRKFVLKSPWAEFEDGFYGGMFAMFTFFFLCVTFFTLRAIFS